MKSWSLHHGITQVLVAMVAALAVSACEAPDDSTSEEALPVTASDSGDAASEVATASLGAGDDPTVTVTSPPNQFSYAWTDGGVLITMEIAVANADVGPNDYHVQYFLDGMRGTHGYG